LKEGKIGQSRNGKALVRGVLERGGKVRTKVKANRRPKRVQPLVCDLAEPAIKLFTDFWLGYE
jgi:hypothetical protein